MRILVKRWGWMAGWCLISLVTSSNYQLEAGDREARYVMLVNIVSEWCGREAGSNRPSQSAATQWNYKKDFITISWTLLLLAFVSVSTMFLL